MNDQKKIAIIFPGIGYHCDKPLLYYGRKLATEAEYKEYIDVSYSCPFKKIRGDREMMRKAFDALYQQAEEMLKDINWDEYEDVLFISKSIGTIIAVSYAQNHKIRNVKQLLYTPLEATFEVMEDASDMKAVAFIGTSDPWSEVPKVIALADAKGITIHQYEGANHSLETDNIMTNLEYLKDVMEKSRSFIM